MVIRSWVVLACFGAKLRHVGGKMATESGKMNQHRRQGANPRGFAGAGWRPGREVPPRGRAVRPKDLGSKDQEIQKVKLKGSKDERSKDSYEDSRYQGLKESSLTLQRTHSESLTALLPQGASGLVLLLL